MKALVIVFIISLVSVSCSQWNKQVVFKKETKKFRVPSSVGITFVQSKSHEEDDKSFQSQCTEVGGEFKYSGCYCQGELAFNPFLKNCN
ncbi:MAG: hypothetical protein ACI9QD_000530 [Thermoproteota archaeon]|jgi:hypothetical protein